MPNLGAPELIIVLVIVMLLFGSSRVTDLAASLGKSVREFRRGVEGRDESPETAAPRVEPPPPAAPPPPGVQPRVLPQAELLMNLQKLKDAGVITEEEFQAKKAKLLSQI